MGQRAISPDPAPDVGERVEVRLRVPAGFGADASVCGPSPTANRSTPRRGSPETAPGDDDGATWWAGEVRVVNPVTSYRFLVETPSGPRWVNRCGTSRRDVADRDDYVVSTFAPPPDWLADSVCYEIFPDRFARGIDEQEWVRPGRRLGDRERLGDTDRRRLEACRSSALPGDLVGAGSASTISSSWASTSSISPGFPRRSCHRYDASTFDHVDPVLGGDVALSALIDSAHRHGIRVIGDLTTNHSGNHHRWFERARPTRHHRKPGTTSSPEHPHDYVGWFDVPSLPKFDLRSAELRRALVGSDGVVARWLRAARTMVPTGSTAGVSTSAT